MGTQIRASNPQKHHSTQAQVRRKQETRSEKFLETRDHGRNLKYKAQMTKLNKSEENQDRKRKGKKIRRLGVLEK